MKYVFYIPLCFFDFIRKEGLKIPLLKLGIYLFINYIHCPLVHPDKVLSFLYFPVLIKPNHQHNEKVVNYYFCCNDSPTHAGKYDQSR